MKRKSPLSGTEPKFTGWSRKGRPFTPQEFGRSYLKKSFHGSYSNYLLIFGEHYKNKRLRKFLLK